MGRKRTQARNEFAATAEVLIREIWDGKWDHLSPDWKSTPIGQWKEVLKEYSVRCPGYTPQEYVDSLRRSFISNRKASRIMERYAVELHIAGTSLPGRA
jgi:hypothetical protein